MTSLIQIRVYVFEARILEGYYISPAITVTCNDISQSTVAKPLTNNPVYNEVVISLLFVCKRYICISKQQGIN